MFRSLFFMSIIGLILPRNVMCAGDPHYVHHACTRRDNLYSSGSIFEANLSTTLLNVLPVNASKSGYSRHTAGIGTNQLYAFSYCRGDVTGQNCRDCVEDAGRTVLQRCEHLKEGIIWYEECTLRYSNGSVIFSTYEVTPSHLKHNFSSVLKSLDQEKNTFNKLMNGLIAKAAKQDDQGKIQGYATRETPLPSSSSMILRGVVQCRPDTVSEACETCLRSALKQMDGWSTPLAFLPNCNLRFDLFPSHIIAPPSSSAGKGSLPRKVLVPVVVAVVVVSVLILSSIVCLIIRYKRKQQQQQNNRNTHLAEGEQHNNIVDDHREHEPHEEGGGASIGVHHYTPTTDVQESNISYTATSDNSQSAAYNPSQNAEQRPYYPEPSAPSLPADAKPVSISLEPGFRKQLEAEPWKSHTHDKFWTLLKNSSMSQQWRWFCSNIMNNSLPPRKSLISPRTKTSCAFCKEEDESLAHVLRDCHLARRIWRNTRLGVVINDKPDLNKYTLLTWFEAMFIYLHSIQDGGDLWTELVATMWAIWTHRNNVVYKGVDADPVEIMKIAVMEKTRWTKVYKNDTKVENGNSVYNCETDVWNWGDDSIALMLVNGAWNQNNSWEVTKGDTIAAKERRRMSVKDQVEAEDYALCHGLKECLRVTKPSKMQLLIWSDSSYVANAFCNPFSIARDSDSIYLFF